jgi:hypothetical protein
MKIILPIGCALLATVFTMSAADESHEDPYAGKVRITKTERMDFPAGGTLHLKNSTGTLTVEGWDEPELEITTVRSSRSDYAGAARDQWTHRLEQIEISVERHGNEMVVTTNYPHHDFPMPGFIRGENAFDLDYRIRVPRNTHLVDEHSLGNVNVDNLTADIDATLEEGEILLRLPEQETYSINAHCRIGHVDSDYAATLKHRPWPFGDQGSAEPSGAAHKLNLKVGYGDILILKTRVPQEPAPLVSTRSE